METLVREPTDEERAAIETAEAGARRQTREQLVYQYGTRSYFADLVLADRRYGGNTAARERLEHHGKQMDEISRRVQMRSLEGTEFEYRVNPNVETGHGGEFAPPLWLNELFATAPRAGEVIQRLVRERGHEFDMPRGASSINLPRITKGTQVNDDTPGGTVDNQDVETEKVKSQALIYSGQSDWAIQDLEQSPQGAHVNWVVFTDMSESLDAELEADLIAGAGETVNEALGLLEVTGINNIAYTSLELKTLFTALGKSMAKVGIERKRPPDAFLMSTARLAYMATTEESEQRPLILTDNVGEDWPTCSLATIPVYLDDAIPRTCLGTARTGGTQEPVFCVRSDDFLLWHSKPTTAIDEDVLSGTMQVRLMLYRTTASMLNRYPSGISAVTGAGMKPASEF